MADKKIPVPNTEPANATRQELSPTVPLTEEVGVAGVKISHGYVYDDFLTNLQGKQGRKVYREMSDNDSTVGSILFAIEMLIRSVPWQVKFNEGDIEASTIATPYDAETSDISNRVIDNPETAIEFVEGVLFDDMEHTWNDFIDQVLSMLVFGWQYTEIVWKRRMGLRPKNPRLSSIFNDGLIGIRKLADRSQETLDRWIIDEKGTLYGMVQDHPYSGEQHYIPMSKAMLFRPKVNKESPEGKSILRNAYRDWFFLKNLQEIEAIAIERELNGLPVMYVPGTVLSDPAKKSQFERVVRDVKLNEQGGLVLPSDLWADPQGEKLTSERRYQLELLTSDGSRAIDTDKVVTRYQQSIARTVLASFIMFGSSGRGTLNQSTKNLTDLFTAAIQGWVDNIASTVNRNLLPKLWAVNALDPKWMPYISPGNVSPEDLDTLGKFVNDLGKAGVSITDEDTVNFLRDAAGMPDAPESDFFEDGSIITPEEEEVAAPVITKSKRTRRIIRK